MNQFSGAGGFEAASERLKQALARLEKGVDAANARQKGLAHIDADRQKLAAERGRLLGELERASQKNRQLDESAAEVARGLVGAMETIKSVLSK